MHRSRTHRACSARYGKGAANAVPARRNEHVRAAVDQRLDVGGVIALEGERCKRPSQRGRRKRGDSGGDECATAHLSCPHGRLLVGRGGLQAQDFPRNVGAQFLAAHFGATSARLAFDDRAALGGNLAVAAEPLADGRLLHPEGGGHCGLAPEALDGAFDWGHALKYRHYRCHRQAHCLLKAVPVAIPYMETPPMHTGAELGKALRAAMELKGVKQQAVADAFGVKQSSVSEWLSFGRLHKKHLTKLLDYFSDVVGPEHWGLPKTWGQQQSSEELLPLAADEIDMISAFRLLDAEDKAEIYSHLAQIVMSKHGPTLRIMERMKLTTRANDASVTKALGSVPKRPTEERHADTPKRPRAARKAVLK